MAGSSFALAFTLSLLCLSSLSFLEAQNGGFSLRLIHRDSPESPFYNPEETDAQRLAKSLRRSIQRANHIHTASSVDPNAAEAKITAIGGSYVMNFSVGSPPVSTVAIADTGSDLVWTQCKPCRDCFEQDYPLFDPKFSKTYRDVSCSSDQCQSVSGSRCSGSGNSCTYQVQYGDQSYSIGNIGVETITLGSTNGRPVALPKIVFGCGHENQGTFNAKTTGIVGLGGGAASLISQMGSSIAGKFSYCLAPLLSKGSGISTLHFGTNAVVSGSDSVSTPLVPGSPDTFYFLYLEAISVGGKRVEYDGSTVGSSDGNIIIDSGTTLTMLPSDFYSKLEAAVSDSIDATPVSDPQGILSLCYNHDSTLKLPTLTVHFKGADVELKPLNTFIAVSDDVVCFTFAANDQGAIYGNLAQVNFLVGYDRQKNTVSFKPTVCNEH